MHAVKGMPRSMYYFARRGPVVRNEGQNLTGTRREREGSDELEVRQHIRACHHPLGGEGGLQRLWDENVPMMRCGGWLLSECGQPAFEGVPDTWRCCCVPPVLIRPRQLPLHPRRKGSNGGGRLDARRQSRRKRDADRRCAVRENSVVHDNGAVAGNGGR